MPAKLWELDPERRDAILNSALREFSAQGYDNASTNVIARNAGMSKGLMFHYVGSKQELFFAVYDYFDELISREYFARIDYGESDIISRLRQSYILQMKLSEKYPWIQDFGRLMRPTDSAEVNEGLERRVQKKKLNCYPRLSDRTDDTKFRRGLDAEKCKQIIFWSDTGFAGQLLEKLRNEKDPVPDSAAIISEIDDYCAQLRNIFYESGDKEEQKE